MQLSNPCWNISFDFRLKRYSKAIVITEMSENTGRTKGSKKRVSFEAQIAMY